MARILSIDFGLKRCGIAVTDPLQIIVNGLTTVETKIIEPFIIEYCMQNPVDKIVIGYPRQQNEKINVLTTEIIAFSERLKTKLNAIEILFYEEHKSSVEASKILFLSGVKKMKRRDKSLIDQMSAVVILQRFLGHI